MIIIQGTVGAGKTTLCEILKDRLNMEILPEPVENNPYLDLYYKQPHKYAFPMQVFFLHSRFKQMVSNPPDSSVIMDMSIYGNDIFVSTMYRMGYMSELDYNTYNMVSDTYKKLVEPPELMVYLKCSTQVAIQRLKYRNRGYESETSCGYWETLNWEYEKWYYQYSDSKKIMIDVTDIDIIKHPEMIDVLVDKIKKAL